MNISRILLTGDDGYTAIGIRLLVHYLKDSYDLAIAATKDQMSGVGGHMNIRNGADVGEDSVDGVPAVWVDGYPSDAIDCAQGYFPKPFDLVISGINLGANVSGSLISSGTFAAAFRSISVGLAPRAMAMSWFISPEHIFRRHTHNDDISRYLPYPGQAAYDLFNLALSQKFWGSPLLNINFPDKPTRSVRITRTHPRIADFYLYPVTFDGDRTHFEYPAVYAESYDSLPESTDCGAVTRGHISVSPCHQGMVDELLVRSIRKRAYTI